MYRNCLLIISIHMHCFYKLDEFYKIICFHLVFKSCSHIMFSNCVVYVLYDAILTSSSEWLEHLF
jgi:hypothetical protein